MFKRKWCSNSNLFIVVSLLFLTCPSLANEAAADILSLENELSGNEDLLPTTTPNSDTNDVQPNNPNDEGGGDVLSNLTTVPSTLAPLNTIKQPSTAASTTTTAATTTTTVGTLQLVVTIVGNTTLQLPDDTLSLSAQVDVEDTTPTADDSEEYQYQWSVTKEPLSAPQSNTVMNEKTLRKTDLKEGVYQFKVVVTDDDSPRSGEANISVSVLAPVRNNQPPVAVITPNVKNIELPLDQVVLDASESSDDDEIIQYIWQRKSESAKDDNTPPKSTENSWTLKNLKQGTYVYELTVIDSDGESDSTTATVNVLARKNNPPVAVPPSDEIVNLPQTSVELDGSQSTDDWDIVKWQWTMDATQSNMHTPDMQGTTTKTLKLSNLEVGKYVFILTVEDEEGLSSSASVSVTVKPEQNTPPVAVVNGEQHVYICDDEDTIVTLDATQSHDEKGIESYKWTQKEGNPGSVTLATPDGNTTTVSGFTLPGDYIFTITVTDAADATDTADITITAEEELPPHADAGVDQTVTLPMTYVELDGSHSTDVQGITKYHWQLDDESPGYGRMVDATSAVLRVYDLLPGVYTFNLHVTNVRGKVGSDAVQVTVMESTQKQNWVELHLRGPLSYLTVKRKEDIRTKLQLLMMETVHIDVISVGVEHRTDDLVVVFQVRKDEGGEIMLSEAVVNILNPTLQANNKVLETQVLYIDSYECNNDCSGHGTCRSKKCECDMFWMENFIRVASGDGRPNCDWSVLYVIIVSFMLLLAIIVGLYFLITCVNADRLRSRKKRKNIKEYVQLSKTNGSARNGLLSKNRTNGGSGSNLLLRSMTSSSDDDQEHIYEKRKLISSNNPSSYHRKGRRKKSNNKTSETSVLVEHSSSDSNASFDGKGLDDEFRRKTSLLRNNQKNNEVF